MGSHKSFRVESRRRQIISNSLREIKQGRIRLRRLFFTLIAALIIVMATIPVSASPAVATRTLPASVESGTTLDVAIESSGCGIFGQVVETLPDGFSYVGCPACGTEEIGVSQADGTIKFAFLGDSANFAYRVKAPEVATTTTYTFHGVVKNENKNEYPMDDDQITVTASAVHPVTYALTMDVNGNGSTKPSAGKNHVYDDGEVVSISAKADRGWEFDHWSSNVSDPYSSSTTVTLNRDRRVTAYFSPLPETKLDSPTYTLTLACQPIHGGNVTISPPGESAGTDEPGENVPFSTHDTGASIQLTAIPSEGYVFSGWGGDLGGSTNPIATIMDSDKSVTASFVLSVADEADFPLSPLSISPEQVQPNQQVNISITVVNSGEQAGSYEAALYINGELEDARVVELAAGSSRDVVFTTTKTTPGAYSVSLGGQQGQFTVLNTLSYNGRLDTKTVIAIIIIAALIVALILVLRRIKKPA
jgi:uncharacterized repeat protein (TIGR02543 family)